MNQEQRIKAAAAISGKSQAEIARELDISPQSFGQMLKKGTIRDAEMEKIAEIVGAEYIVGFVFPDGTKI